jgi:hypothetical protein
VSGSPGWKKPPRGGERGSDHVLTSLVCAEKMRRVFSVVENAGTLWKLLESYALWTSPLVPGNPARSAPATHPVQRYPLEMQPRTKRCSRLRLHGRGGARCPCVQCACTRPAVWHTSEIARRGCKELERYILASGPAIPGSRRVEGQQAFFTAGSPIS